jgi:hypothetical protein
VAVYIHSPEPSWHSVALIKYRDNFTLLIAYFTTYRVFDTTRTVQRPPPPTVLLLCVFVATGTCLTTVVPVVYDILIRKGVMFRAKMGYLYAVNALVSDELGSTWKEETVAWWNLPAGSPENFMIAGVPAETRTRHISNKSQHHAPACYLTSHKWRKTGENRTLAWGPTKLVCACLSPSVRPPPPPPGLSTGIPGARRPEDETGLFRCIHRGTQKWGKLRQETGTKMFWKREWNNNNNNNNVPLGALKWWSAHS